MDAVEVLALLRPEEHDHLTLDDLSLGFKMLCEMVRRNPQRCPSASVSFLGAHTNVLTDDNEGEPSFETVLHARRWLLIQFVRGFGQRDQFRFAVFQFCHLTVQGQIIGQRDQHLVTCANACVESSTLDG